jgi:hypothetical protein
MLVARLRSLLASGRLQVAVGLPGAEPFLRELADFRVSVTPRGSEAFGAGARGARDDLVLAVALAAWPPG